ncbi:MAG TPA: transposase [Aquabacterium sp.]|nr:transposase [Aquabacterium sp.]
MARLPRLECPSFPHLVVQRVVSGVPLTVDQVDQQWLWQCLLEAGRAHDVAVHAYVLMPDHFYVLATPAGVGALGAFMQSVGRRYVATYNRRHARQGSLWAGRFRATVIDPARYLLDAMVFIESQPWQHEHQASTPGPVATVPSSLGQHLNRRTDPLVSDHAAFWALGNTPFDREAAWRKRLEQGLSAESAAALAQAADKGWVRGDEAFVRLLQQQASSGGPSAPPRRMVPARRGRPRKVAAISQ